VRGTPFADHRLILFRWWTRTGASVSSPVDQTFQDQTETIVIANSLLSLGTFSFEGLESPEQIHLKTKQRIAIHRLGSGLSIADCLGEDCETASFRGIFSGASAVDRISSLDYLRIQGMPLTLTWGSQALSVIIQEFELDYSSDLWIPYKLSCYVVRSTGTSENVSADETTATAATQVGNMLSLLNTTGINPTSGQVAATTALAMLNYDLPSPSALSQAQELVHSIDNRLARLASITPDDALTDPGSDHEQANWINAMVTNLGLRAALVLARNRLMSVVVRAESINQL
jgi:hypothetical protein